MPLNIIASLENVGCKPVGEFLALDSKDTMHSVSRLEYKMICEDSTDIVHSMMRLEHKIYPLHYMISSDYKAISGSVWVNSPFIDGTEE